MRRILVDLAREENALKKGREWTKIPLQPDVPGKQINYIELLALDEALNKLAKLSEVLVQIIELRFFGGHTVQEIADVLGISKSKVEKDFPKAQAFLYQQLTVDP